MKVLCLSCNHTFYIKPQGFCASPLYCECCNSKSEQQKFSLEQAQDKMPEGYILLKYESYHKKALIQHSGCGFIFSQNYSNFLTSKGCPKCFRTMSKGEQIIFNFLKKKEIAFSYQKSLEAPYKRFHFDFFLPDYNLAIEYQGEQHYKEKKMWDSFENVKKRDEIKRKYCVDKGIELMEIPYWDYNKIKNILISKLNDYHNE